MPCKSSRLQVSYFSTFSVLFSPLDESSSRLRKKKSLRLGIDVPRETRAWAGERGVYKSHWGVKVYHVDK